jgi:hypothetical protein
LVNDRGVNVEPNMHASAADVLAMRFLYPGRTSIAQLDVLYRQWFGEGLLENLQRSWLRVAEFTSDCYDQYERSSCEPMKNGGQCGTNPAASGCRKTCGACLVQPPPRPPHPYYDALLPSTDQAPLSLLTGVIPPSSTGVPWWSVLLGVLLSFAIAAALAIWLRRRDRAIIKN